MSGRSYENNVNGRGNGAAGRGAGHPNSYGNNVVPGTSSLQANASTYYYPPNQNPNLGHSYPMGHHIQAQYYSQSIPMVGMWQQNPPTGSTHGAVTSTPSGTANAALSANTGPYPHAAMHAIPIASNQAPYIQGYRQTMPQHNMWPMQQGATYMSPAHMGMMTSSAQPTSSFNPQPTAESSVQPPRQKKILNITDKSGKPLDIIATKPAQASASSEVISNATPLTASSSAEVSNTTNLPSTSVASHEAGMKLREAAERAIMESGGTIPMKRKDDDERIRKEQEEFIQRQKQQQAAEELEAKMAEEKLRKQAEEEEAEERARQEEKAKKEAEERARTEAEDKVRQEAEEKARLEAAALKREAPRLSSLAARMQPEAPTDSASPYLRSDPIRGLRPTAAKTLASLTASSSTLRKVYSKIELLRSRDLDICCHRPADLPEMSFNSSASNNRRGSSSQWSREANKPFPSPQESGKGDHSNRRQTSAGSANSAHSVTTPEQWTRGLAMQRNTSAGRGGRGGRGDRGGSFGQNFQEYEDPVPVLKRSENRWVPIKDTSAFVTTEKTVKSILNKMTKEKFEKLSDQMCEIKIFSHAMLTMMINNIYEKAIYEPAFSDMYAELCVKLAQNAKATSFVHVIESDEEPPTDDGTHEPDGNKGASSGPTYRWSNDVNTDDSELVGPFRSPDECINCAHDAENCPDPCPRDGMELDLHNLKIHQGMFIKIMHPKNDPSTFYTVFFPMSKVEEVGQHINKDLFLSSLECVKDMNKQNNFKRILLYKCEDEFNKKDIYDEWKKEKKTYEEHKSTLNESERLEKEGELEFRRMKIKKQMLGNIKFIGELFKKEMLKEKIMHYCIQQLLKIEEKNGELTLIKDDEMDEEDHDALFNLFSSIGSKVDNVLSRPLMNYYFKRIAVLSADKNLSSRSKFMYKDLMELKENKWKARREEETAKTLDEIKKDFEREERLAAQQSQIQSRPMVGNLVRNTSSSSRGSGRGRGGPNYGDPRDDSRRDHNEPLSRQKSVKEFKDTRSFTRPEDLHQPQILTRAGSAQAKPSFPPEKPKLLNIEERKEIIKKKAKFMRSEFIQSNGRLSEEDILFSFKDIMALPDAGQMFVQVNADASVDCKPTDREAVISILSVLVLKGKLTFSDFDEPFGQLIEFIADFVVDSPTAVQDIGDMIAAFIHIKALSFPWLCELCERLRDEPCAEFFTKLISRILESLVQKHGEKASLGPCESRFSHLLGESNWNQVKCKL